MNISLTGVVLMAGDNGALNLINNGTDILIAAMMFLVLVKLAPLIVKGKMTQIIGSVIVCATIMYFAKNPGAFDNLSNYFVNMTK